MQVCVCCGVSMFVGSGYGWIRCALGFRSGISFVQSCLTHNIKNRCRAFAALKLQPPGNKDCRGYGFLGVIIFAVAANMNFQKSSFRVGGFDPPLPRCVLDTLRV